MEQIKTSEMDDSHPSAQTIVIDFKDTENAFAHLSDKELKKTKWLFTMMNNHRLVSFLSFAGLWAVKLRLPFADFLVKKTIFPQFCGGENLLDCQKAIDHLYKNDVLTILDYGAEGKDSEDDLDNVKEENLKGIDMAASNNSVPAITIKVTGLVANEVLEKIHLGGSIPNHIQQKFDQCERRLDEICQKAFAHGVGVLIDAEESWIQKPIDDLALKMMSKYNTDKVIIYNTYQLYRHDKLAQLKEDYQTIVSEGCLFGAKIVRGAYMDKENERAQELEYPTPIQPNKEATDRDFNLAVEFCVTHYKDCSFICGTHNLNSNQLLAKLVDDNKIDRSHPHINLSQLYGMSDFITFNLAKEGFNVAKYVPYGPVKEVIPYLIRRAQENSSVTGEMGRELSMVSKEVQRRGI